MMYLLISVENACAQIGGRQSALMASARQNGKKL